MAKLVVTSTANSILVVMNDYFTSAVTQDKEGVWRKERIHFRNRGTYVLVEIDGESDWKVSNVEDLPNKILQIDSVDGTSPIADADTLFSLLKVLLG